MNGQLIEQTTKQAQRLVIAEKASHCIKWLRIQGFVVRHVLKGHNGPLIIVEASPLCDQLEGAIAVYERSLKGAQRYKKVMRLDCEVRWEDKGGMQ